MMITGKWMDLFNNSLSYNHSQKMDKKVIKSESDIENALTSSKNNRSMYSTNLSILLLYFKNYI
jgi:hypothetical protein